MIGWKGMLCDHPNLVGAKNPEILLGPFLRRRAFEATPPHEVRFAHWGCPVLETKYRQIGGLCKRRFNGRERFRRPVAKGEHRNRLDPHQARFGPVFVLAMPR